MMSWQVIELRNISPSPWRNGGGVTRELLAWPDAQDWVWRMSVAEVASGGPFSKFEGVQRWFAVLAGAGVRLDVAGQATSLTRLSAPFEFDGAAPVLCDLIDGSTQDFNLMLRQGRASARMQRVSGMLNFTSSGPVTVALYAAADGATLHSGDETLTLPPHSLLWRQLAPGCSVRAESRDALWMEIDA